MEHVLVEVAPGRRRATPAAAAMQPDSGRVARRSRRSRQQASEAWQPARHRREAARQRAALREFESLVRVTL